MSDTPAHLTNLESALAGLAPSAGLNRDQLLFEAGKLAAPRRLHWPMIATALAALSAVLGVELASRPEPTPRVVKEIVYVPTAPPVHQEVALPTPLPATVNDESRWGNAFRSSAGYLSQRDLVLYFGLDALPAAPVTAGSVWKPVNDLKSLLQLETEETP